MRILLTSSASYAPPRGGSTRSNLAWLRYLATSGHSCHVVCTGDADATVEVDGITIHSIAELTRRVGVLGDRIRALTPDRVFVSSEDLSHVLLREADAAADGGIIYLAHTPQFMPFGPESWNPNEKAAAVVRRARAVVAIGRHMADYIERHAGVRPLVIHPPIYGEAPWPEFGRFSGGSVLMINPCRVKGVGIFVELAARFPERTFEALAGWGTTSEDRQLLAYRPNVRVLESVARIDDVLERASVLVMPSIWYEGFGLIAMEAMLRGLPVISSDSGGLREAKQGTGYVIPVRPVTRYLAEFDETRMPRPVEPEQDIEPWVAALRTLFTDESAYGEESRRSRERAAAFVSGLKAADIELALGRMRILLAHNSLYYPSFGGGDKSNRLLMEALAARGHDVRVVTRIERFGEDEQARYVEQVAEAEPSVADGVVRFRRNGVDVRTLAANPRMRAYFSEQIREFDPDVVITSTDDPAQLLFGAALEAKRARVAHLVRATIAAPFGPDASTPNAVRAEALRRADVVVGVSEYVARYVREFGGIPAVHAPISLMETREPELVARFDNSYIAFANPCAVKGIDIFLGLADALPELAFAAVPTWGTTTADLAELRARTNVTLLEPVEDMTELFRRTRVLLVPSIWAEARSRIVVEAMLHGVPVMASDVGGIPEAKLGVPYLLPVNKIRSYRAEVDENMAPVAELPLQDIGPWVAVLRRLVTDRAHWEEISRRSREAALKYVRELDVGAFERLLRATDGGLAPRAPRAVASLSADQRKLLALRLRRKAASPWFPALEDVERRVFCFPHAGGGTLMYRSWRLPGLTPVCLPGREQRLREPAFEDMDALVTELAGAIRPYLDRPFAFFGHSMGAAVAFELARRLRRLGLTGPERVIVSAARAPRFRLNYTPPPDPTDEEFLAELRRLEGVPAELLERPDALRILLPALKADARLYRRYVYCPGAPLQVPIVAYIGKSDPNVRREHVEGWGEQSASGFSVREFEGGHFYLHQQREAFLAALREDVTPA